MRCAGLMLVLAVLTGGCAEERVVGVRGGLQSIPGATGGIRAETPDTRGGDTAWAGTLAAYQPEVDGEPVEGRPLRIAQEPDGSIILLNRSPRELVINLHETLRDQEHDLLFEQVLSEQTKQRYRDRSRDPRDAVTWLARNERPIQELLATMPAGEQTPGAFLQPLGDNAYRIEAPGRELLDLKYSSLDVVVEQGQFRLLLIH
ncbi:MAG: hypothetical protein AAFX05_02545 [Planctomycetota bacterium]